MVSIRQENYQGKSINPSQGPLKITDKQFNFYAELLPLSYTVRETGKGVESTRYHRGASLFTVILEQIKSFLHEIAVFWFLFFNEPFRASWPAKLYKRTVNWYTTFSKKKNKTKNNLSENVVFSTFQSDSLIN